MSKTVYNQVSSYLDNPHTHPSIIISLTLGKQGIVTRFGLPFVGSAVSRSLKAGSSDNFLEKARRAVVGTMEDMIGNYEENKDDDGSTTVADIIGSELTGLLGPNGAGILKSSIEVTYYEHIDGSLVNHSSYDPNLEIKSLMWTIPFGKHYLVFGALGRGYFVPPNLPAHISTPLHRTSIFNQPTTSGV
jgi:hypothetical protein